MTKRFEPVAGQGVDRGGRREPPVPAAAVGAQGAPRRPVPSRDVVGLRDARDVVRVRADVRVGPDGGETADEGGDRAAARSGARAHGLPGAPGGQVGDVVGGGDVLQVAEPSARVERAVAVGRQRVHRAGEGVGRIDDRGARGAGGQVAGEQVVGGRDARAVLELAADVERLADDLQAGHVPVERRPGRVAERLPARAVPDREEVGVRVTPRVLEGATGVDLAGGHGDGGDAAVRDLRRRRADRAPAAAVPRRDAIRVGNAARVGELAAHVERARRHRQRGGDEVQRVGPGCAPVPEVVPAAGAGGRRQRHERADDHGRECEDAEEAALAGRAEASHQEWLLPSGTQVAYAAGGPGFSPLGRPYALPSSGSTAPSNSLYRDAPAVL